jgi:uncharacterized repeat protein (TIGR01451 family)
MPRLLAGFARVHAASQWLRRRFTPAGLAVLMVCVAAGVLGVDTERSMAFQVFALSAALLLVAWLATACKRAAHLTLQRELPRHATAGMPMTYRLLVRNNGTRTVAAATLCDTLAERFPSVERFRNVGDHAAGDGNWLDRRIGYPRWLALVRQLRGGDLPHATLPGLQPGETLALEIAFAPLRRGPLRFSGVYLLRPDPIGLLNAIDATPMASELLVLPRRYPLPRFALPGARRLQRGGVRLAATVGESEEFMQLRDYRPGDGLRHVHWRSFARLGKPVVKEYEDEYFTRHALALDTFATPADGDAFEAAVSVAASLAGSFDQQDALLDLMFVEDRTYLFTAGRATGDVSELLRVLAALQSTPEASFERLAQHVLSHATRLSGCVLVLLDLDAPRRALVERLRAHAHVLVLVVRNAPCPPEPDVQWIDPRDPAASLRALRLDWR